MLEPKQGSPLHHYSRAFRGIRFVLLGFDPNKRLEVLSKLVNGGGNDVGVYSPNCTHVIVDKLVYDEPPCVAARKDGKILVTSLWVDHSFDVGMPVDHTSIMYRPLKDLKGIPGAKSLLICLTGYQRHDRDDIMALVGLMGATFSKPLVAAKVTHLICYKFEGEKYALAKKMGRIKLVNHRWLEDSLKAWEILPEGNYDMSSFELELAEAEAKDSEEETEDVTTKKGGDELTNPDGQNQTSKMEVSTNITDPNSSKRLLNVDVTLDISSLTAKQTTSVQLPNFNEHINQHHDVSGCERSKQYDRTETPSGVAKDLVSSSCTSAKKSPHSDTYTSGLKSYTRKSLNRTSPIFSREMSDNLHSSSPVANVIDRNLSDGFNISPFRAKQPNPGSSVSGLKTPLVGADAHPEEGHGGKLPEKRTSDVSAVSLKSQNTKGQTSEALTPKVSSGLADAHPVEGHGGKFPEKRKNDVSPVNLKSENTKGQTSEALSSKVSSGLKTPLMRGDAHPEEGHSVKIPEKRKSGVSSVSLKSQNTKGQSSEALAPKVSTVDSRRNQVFQPASKTDAQVKSNNIVSPNSDTHYLNETAAFVPAPTSRTILSPRAMPSFEDVEKEFGKRFLVSDTTEKLTSKSDKPDACVSNSKDGIGEAENQIASIGVLSPTSLKSDTEKPNSSPTNDLVKSGSDDKSSKPLRIKMVAKKFFGSKKRSGKESSSSGQKGSIYLNKDTSHNITVARSETTEYHSANSESKSETKDAQPCGNEAENKSGFMDDETEPPEEDQLENEAPIGRQKNAQTEAEDVQDLTNTKDEHQMDIDEDICVSEQRSADDCEKSGVKKSKGTKDAQESGNVAEFMDDETETLEEDKVEDEPGAADIGEEHAQIEPEDPSENMPPHATDNKDEHQMEVDDNMDRSKVKTAVRGENSEVGEPGHVDNASKGTKRFSGKTKKKIAPSVTKEVNSDKKLRKNERKNNESNTADLTVKRKGRKPANKVQKTSELGKEDMPIESCGSEVEKTNKIESKTVFKNDSSSDPVWFILTGHKLQKKEYQQVIARLKGRVCRVSHQWSYKATHFIVPDPIRRTEKFFAAAASGRWILKTDYLSDSNKAGKFLEEEAYEWHKNSLNEDGAINLEAPRKWRLTRERTGHGAFHGMNIIIYGDCIAPSLDTLKRVTKAGGGTILATSPPYSRFLESEVDFAIVSPGIPQVDMWVQEFLRHEIPCVLADYLVEYVCKPGYSLERYVQYNTHAWAEKSLQNLMNRVEDNKESVDEAKSPENEDIACRVCGSQERGEVMLICGDERGLTGCGAGTHIDCCDPPLESVPDHDWFCPNCTTTTTTTTATVSKTIKNPAKRPKKATPVSGRRK